MIFAKKKPITFNHVRHAGDDPRVWTCNACAKRYHRWSEPGTSEPVGSPALSLELPPHRAAGMSQPDFERHLAAGNQAGGAPWLGTRVPVSAFLDYCSACQGKAYEMQRALLDEAQPGKPKPTSQAAVDDVAIKQYLAKQARAWSTPEYLAESEWMCVGECHRRVHTAGNQKVVEQPLLKWHLPQVQDPYGRVIAGAGEASLCEKCARAIDQEARKAFAQNQTVGATTT